MIYLFPAPNGFGKKVQSYFLKWAGTSIPSIEEGEVLNDVKSGIRNVYNMCDPKCGLGIAYQTARCKGISGVHCASRQGPVS